MTTAAGLIRYIALNHSQHITNQMSLKPATSEALDEWLSPDTWHTKHDLDMVRLYDFVDQYQKDHGYTINEIKLQEEIEKRADVSDGSLQEVIRERISLAYNILDFLEHTGR